MKLKLADISKTFPSNDGQFTTLEGVNLDIGEGEFICLVGPSGCGKSTLLNIIAGFEKPDDGLLMYDGQPINGAGTGRVMIFQEPALFPWLTVRKNIEFGLKMAGVSRQEREERAQNYLKLVHLSRFANSFIHELSGGMKQRVAIARALALDPDVLLMDEPFAALDCQTRDMLHAELQEIWAETKKTIIFVTHNVREAVCLGDRVIVMSTRPAAVKREFRIELARPRDAMDADVSYYANLISKELKDEVEKIAKEEYDEEWLISKSSVFYPADSRLGSGI